MLGRIGLGQVKDVTGRLWLCLGLISTLCGVTLGNAAEEETLDVVYQGIPHDALYDLCFDGGNGLAVGLAGTVLESADAGVSWEADTTSVTEKALLGVTCSDGSAVAVGQNGHIQVRTAGESWQTVDSGTDQRLLSVDSNVSDLVFAVGGFGTILRSRDGGANWEPLTLDWEAILNDFLEPHIYDVMVFDDNTVVIVGEFELVLLSSDGGDNWEVVNKGDSSLAGIYFTDRQNGYAAGQNGKVLKTVDGGLSWQSLEVETRENLLDVWASGDDVYVPGIRTLLHSRDGGASWESVTEGDVSVSWYQSVKGTPTASGKRVFMVGHSGRILQIKN